MIGHYKLINKGWVLYNQNSQERCHRGIYPNKIYVKDTIAVPIPIKFSKKFHRGIYPHKIHVKDTIAVPIYWKFNIQIPESLYRSKIASPDTVLLRNAVSGEAIFTI